MMKNNERNPIGMSKSNPIIDTRVYKVEYVDGYRQILAANVISENLFYQVNEHRR